MTQANTLQQQIQEAEAIVNELRKKLDEERKGQRMEALTLARELIKTHALTASDLGFTGKSSASKSSIGDKRNVVAPKYQDPESGKTWTGRGKSPAWLSAHLVAGRNKEEFLIKR
jgi:DNA-binding protein H-NS